MKVGSFGRSEAVGSERRTNKHSVHDGWVIIRGKLIYEGFLSEIEKMVDGERADGKRVKGNLALIYSF